MRILVNRNDMHGDVMAATSVLKGLQEKYPGAEIDFMVDRRFSLVLQNNPRCRIVYRKQGHYDLEIPYLDHHYQWSDHMARVHCRIAGVPFNPPELYLTQTEIDSCHLRGRIAFCNQAGWRCRTFQHMNEIVSQLTNTPITQIDISPRVCGLHQPRLGIRETAAIIYHSRFYFGIDTVFMHIAAALQKPMLLVLGPTCSHGNYSQYVPNAMIVRPGPPTFMEDPAYQSGIDVSPERVVEAYKAMVDGRRPPGFVYTGPDGYPLEDTGD